MEKQCFKCLRTLPICEFYKHPRMADGRLGKCKECTKRDVRENRAKRCEQYSEYEAERNKKPCRKAATKRYQKRARRRNPEKTRARNMVRYHLRKGNITRKPCEVCNDPRAEAHHDDYSRPLDVRWLCFLHHREAHGQHVVQVDHSVVTTGIDD